MLRPAAHRWSRAVIAILFVAVCGGSGDRVTPGTAARDTGARVETAQTEQNVFAACPVGSKTLIAGLRAMSLPCLTDPASAVSVTAVHGQPEVINFWASWCVPCRREAALLQDAHRRTGDRVTFLGIDSRDDRQAALRFLAESGATYPHAFDPPGAFALQLGVVAMPYTVFVDASGQIVDRHIGELTAERLRSALSRIGVTTDPGG